MSMLQPAINGDSVFFDEEECRIAGAKLEADYNSARPFPHIVIDDFLPVDVLKRVLEEFPERQTGNFDDAQSRLKTGYPIARIESPFIKNLLFALNTAPMIRFLEGLTGISGLITDHDFTGGSLHETARGGHLSIHQDFNIQKNLKLIRRMNLIIFLNENWLDEYGGYLELWNKEMTTAEVRVSPEIGRAVVFNTDDYSYHGHPDPLSTPEGVYRRSIALYYYTSPPRGIDYEKAHSTLFQSRQGTGDVAPKRTLLLKEFLQDCCPPIILRKFTKN